MGCARLGGARVGGVRRRRDGTPVEPLVADGQDEVGVDAVGPDEDLDRPAPPRAAVERDRGEDDRGEEVQRDRAGERERGTQRNAEKPRNTGNTRKVHRRFGAEWMRRHLSILQLTKCPSESNSRR